MSLAVGRRLLSCWSVTLLAGAVVVVVVGASVVVVLAGASVVVAAVFSVVEVEASEPPLAPQAARLRPRSVAAEAAARRWGRERGVVRIGPWWHGSRRQRVDDLFGEAVQAFDLG